MINRLLFDHIQKSNKSILLLGPRQTGKSTLISELNPELTVNLMHEPTYMDFASNPSELEERLLPLSKSPKKTTVFIDEIQRLPSILNTIQTIIDNPQNKLKFYITGSSARKLRRGRANLLPGRIYSFYLGPVVSREMHYMLDTRTVMSTGCLPGILTERNARFQQDTLLAYAATYLKEEVQTESLTRNLEGFARFLRIAGEWASRYLDLSKMSSLAQVPRQSAVRYFEILEDCLLVQRVDAFSKSSLRRLVQHPKFYFFDPGVLNGLLGNFIVSPDRIGFLFENLVFCQLYFTAKAINRQVRISTYRTDAGAEVDFIVETESETIAIETKATRVISRHDLRGLKSFAQFYGGKHRPIVFYVGDVRKRIDSVDIFPWQHGLKEIGF